MHWTPADDFFSLSLSPSFTALERAADERVALATSSREVVASAAAPLSIIYGTVCRAVGPFDVEFPWKAAAAAARNPLAAPLFSPPLSVVVVVCWSTHYQNIVTTNKHVPEGKRRFFNLLCRSVRMRPVGDHVVFSDNSVTCVRVCSRLKDAPIIPVPFAI